MDFVPQLRRSVIDADLQRRKAAFQLDCAPFGAFLGTEFGLDATIDLERIPGLREIRGMKNHVVSPATSCDDFGYGESARADKRIERWTSRRLFLKRRRFAFVTLDNVHAKQDRLMIT
ncbi:hypothetical protein V1291_005333 [Nitrobacteraceae bacterium AZCC 1564]